ncbi:MAG: hypothetical protein DMF68_00350, partial [Acidobacteria bacterium]
MQKCLKCGRTYESDTQKFCTHDGGRLESYTSASSQAPTAYDLNQTIRTDPFDPEATVPRIPDLNKTVASLPTSEIRSKETGPATPPPAAQPKPPQQTPESREQQPTVVFNQPPPPPTPSQQPYYQQPQSQQQPAQPAMQQPQQQYAPAHFQQQPPHAAQAPSAPARKKSSRVPLIIGLVVILLAGAAAAWYFLIYKKGSATANSNTNVANTNANANTSADANANSNTNVNANTSANANTNAAPPPPPQPPNTTQFVNSKANLDGKLAEYYSDFSFYYPKSWKLDPVAGVAGAKNFAKIDRQDSPDFPQERFVVSYYESKGTLDADMSNFPSLVETYGSNFAKGLPNYKKVSEGETKVGPYDAYEF